MPECPHCLVPQHHHRLDAHKRTCDKNPNRVERQYKKREYKKRGAYKKSKQAEKQEEKRQEVEDSSNEDLQQPMEDATMEEATKDTTVEKRKRREKIVTKGALVRDGYYICNSCDKPVCLENDKHRNIARAFRLFGHKNCVPVLKR